MQKLGLENRIIRPPMPGQWLSQGVLVACWRGLHLFFTFYRTHVQAITFYHILINLFIYLFIMFLMAN